METCSEYIVAAIGILKAGAAFMPVPLDSPDHLLSAMLTESQPKIVVRIHRRGGVTAAGWAMSGKGGRWFGQDFG